MNIGEKETDQPINLPIPVHPSAIPVEPAIPVAPIAEPEPEHADAELDQAVVNACESVAQRLRAIHNG